MSFWRIIVRSLGFHWRINFAVALGVAAATAVLTGALLVGDSVRGSLRELTLDGLGRIDEALITDRFFRRELAAELEANDAFQQYFDSATPAIVFPRATVERSAEDWLRLAGGITALGVTSEFWELGSEGGPRPQRLPAEGEVILNRPLADELGAEVGDAVTVRLVKAEQAPADSPLGRRSDRTRSLPNLEVIEILPAEGLGRFSLRPSQHMPRNAYLSMDVLQDALDQEERVNAILAAGRSPDEPPSEVASRALDEALEPTLADYGFSLDHVVRTFQPSEEAPEETIFDYYNFTTDRMVFGDAAAAVAREAFAPYGAQPVLTYLANLIEKAPEDDSQVSEEATRIPYSMISALDPTQELGPLMNEAGEPLTLADDEVVLVDWAAEQLDAEVGDRIRVSYFAPETTHGQTTELTADFRLAAIAPLTAPSEPYTRRRPAQYDERPRLTNDPDLTPVVEGLTDQATIDNWDAPFPMPYRVRPVDDDYWQDHRTTPKAYISLSKGQELWGSRFGDLTSFRIPASKVPDGDSAEEVLEAAFLNQLEESGEDLGFTFRPIKRIGLEAAKGTTQFNFLFIGFSFFIIAAAVMLTALLFRLGLERRAREVGLLLAVGTPRGKATWLYVTEGVAVAAIGGVLGVAAGVGYAWLMLVGLRTLWLEAIVTPFVNLHVSGMSLLIGYISGVLVSALTIAWTARRMQRVSVRRLMSGQATEAPTAAQNRRRLAEWISAGLLAIAIALAILATQLRGEAQAGAFFGGGAAVLAAALTFLWAGLRRGGRAAAASYSLSGLAARNAGRNPLRSTLTIGLTATACFLIVAISAFRMAPTAEGVGGFDLMAESDRPLFTDLDDPQQRPDVLGRDAPLLDGGAVLSLRLKPGEDASCRNIYQTTRPQVVGVTPQLYERFSQPGVQHFAWSASAAETEAEQANPWLVLRRPLEPGDDAVPMALDKNTAMYSLHLMKGVGEEFTVTYDDGRTVKFRVAGLLSNTILQGSLFIDEEQFTRLYPEVSGYNYFLIDAPEGSTAELERVLESRLSDQGFDVRLTTEVLTNLLAVQNTYLSTFQSLGALGLLLGVFGLATVQLRSVLERRGELALMRATGFRRNRLAEMVMLENAVLLLGGLAVGVFAAINAVAPHIAVGGASVPVAQLAWMLAIILVVGLLSGLAAVLAVLRAPLLTALREE
ncbi:MAG: ABC transporter permease [Planctomycetes bacterium]|nr:ABC transporter permease [Planctomycetota bacterium]